MSFAIRPLAALSLLAVVAGGATVTLSPAPVHAVPGQRALPAGCADQLRAARLSKTAGVDSINCLTNSTRESGPQALAAAETCGPNWTVNSRQSACGANSGTFFVIQRPTGAVLGWMDYRVTMRITVNGRSNRWTHTITITPTAASGAVIAGTTLTAQAECGFNCARAVSWVFAGGPASVGSSMSGSATFESVFAGVGSIWHTSSQWSWWWTNPNTTPRDSAPASWRSIEARCDDTLGSSTVAGCAFDSFRPTHEIGRLRYPMYAKHIELAIQARVPSVLTRTTNGELNDRNYNIACPTGASYPRPAGFSCDEYPFRSTYEGAASQGLGWTFFVWGGWNSPNPPFWCQIQWLPLRRTTDYGGYSACMIPSGENSGGGSDLNGFYYDNRVIDRDAFEVRIVS